MEQNNPHQNQTFMSIRELTISGLLAGITIFLGLTGYGFIPLVVMNATILHIPTIIGTVVAGPKVGILVGFLFGLFSFIQTLRAPSLMMQFALQYSVIADAFICIVPRICIPIVVWLLYKYIPGNAHLRAGISAVGGAITNTVLFLGSFFLLVGAPYAAAKGDLCRSGWSDDHGDRHCKWYPGSSRLRCHRGTDRHGTQKSRMENEIRKQAKSRMHGVCIRLLKWFGFSSRGWATFE